MAQNLRIGITCYPTFGGSGVIATELGLELAGQGHDIHFISSRPPVRLAGRPAADVSFHEVNSFSYALFQQEPYTLSLAAKMAQVAETYKLDILHVHYALPHAVSAILARQMLGGGPKVITTLHGTDITLVGADPSLAPMVRYAIEHSDAVTAVSEWLRKETLSSTRSAKEISFISNFVDTEAFAPDREIQDCSAKHLDCKSPRLIHVSNFRPVKRAADSVEILARVLAKHDCHLLMVGDGPDLGTAIQRAQELGVSEYVSFLGNREDVASLFAASEIALVPSGSESFGLSALEAMASGCAVVASDIGGLPELIRPGVHGYLCPVGAVDVMASCVTDLLSNPVRLAAMQKAARDHAVSHYATKRIVPQYLDLYRSTLAGAAAAEVEPSQTPAMLKSAAQQPAPLRRKASSKAAAEVRQDAAARDAESVVAAPAASRREVEVPDPIQAEAELISAELLVAEESAPAQPTELPITAVEAEGDASAEAGEAPAAAAVALVTAEALQEPEPAIPAQAEQVMNTVEFNAAESTSLAGVIAATNGAVELPAPPPAAPAKPGKREKRDQAKKDAKPKPGDGGGLPWLGGGA